VLDFNDDVPDLAVREVQDVLDDGRVLPCPSGIANQDSQPATRQQGLVAPL
jgi:hypothetical protein